MIRYLIWHVLVFLAFIDGKAGHTSAWTLAMAASMSFWLYFRTSMMDSSALAGCGNGVTRLSRIGGWKTVTAWMNECYTNSYFSFKWANRVRDGNAVELTGTRASSSSLKSSLWSAFADCFKVSGLKRVENEALRGQGGHKRTSLCFDGCQK